MTCMFAGRSVGLSERPNADYLELLARVPALRAERGKAILRQRQAIEAAPEAQRRALSRTLEEYEAAQKL